MECPRCGTDSKLSVINSRKHKEGVSRRRECSSCGSRFNTIEILEISRRPQRPQFLIIDQEGKVNPFSPERIVESIKRYCPERFQSRIQRAISSKAKLAIIRSGRDEITLGEFVAVVSSLLTRIELRAGYNYLIDHLDVLRQSRPEGFQLPLNPEIMNGSGAKERK